MSSSSSENTPPERTESPERVGKTKKPSPPRRPLHDRSNSQTNERQGPTIRIVSDSDTDVYSKSPYPSHPSQLFPPRNAGSGYVFESQGSGVSDYGSSTNAHRPSGRPYQTHTLVPKPLQPRRGIRTSASTSTSEAETSLTGSTLSPSSPRFSQDTTPPTSPIVPSQEKTTGLEDLKEESPPRPTIRAVPATPEHAPELTAQTSKTSLVSSTSESTIHYHERSSSASSSNLPPPPRTLKHAKRPFYVYPRSKKQASAIHQSTESLVSSLGSSDRPETSSTYAAQPHVARQATIQKAAQIQYPLVRAPQTSGSWVDTQPPTQSSSSRMTDRASGHKWSSQLSTIQSESDWNSQSVSGGSHFSVRSPHGANVTSEVSTGGDSVSSPSNTSVAYPPPLFTGQRQADGRYSDEHEDTLAELQSPPLRQQRSGYFSRFSPDPRPSSSRSRRSSLRPSSSSSDLANFIANTIPAWAR
jgi:hypothetical protein